jgi:3',5'-cyclic AMP phosphodiesterase CpdA
MSTLLQISDTHFGTERPAVVDALRRFTLALRPDLVVLSGDITQRARRRQFSAARAFVDSLQAPAVVAIPGNHDIPLFNLVARIFSPYSGFVEAFGAELEPAYESHDMLVLCVNTTRPWRHKHGEVSATQMERVAQRLRACPPQKLRIVVTHQPIHVPPGDENNLLRGHAEALRAWAAAGANLIMGGHVHLPFITQCAVLLVVQAGTAVSHRVRPDAPANSVNLVRHDPASQPGICVVERWDYDVQRNEFAPVDRVRVLMRGSGEERVS